MRIVKILILVAVAVVAVVGFGFYNKVAGGSHQEVILADAASVGVTEDGCLATFQHQMRGLHTNTYHDLCQLTAGKVVMVVNTASQCGYTGQFEGLEALYEEYHDSKFVILGFPSDSFRQEHDDEAETATVCFVNYGVTFPMMATSKVTGDEANPVFQELTAATNQAPAWNFHKYIVSADGKQITSFPSKVEPRDEAVTAVIDRYLEAVQ